jgi:regulator of sirC expression with transglutaminase-like and TPR domain
MTGDSKAALRAIGAGPDHPIALAKVALALGEANATGAANAPATAFYHEHLETLREAVGRRAARTVHEAHENLCAVLAEEYGYQGDDQTYDDLQNANLRRVIDRRKGLPVALGILYIDAARAQGWTISGLAFPGHFLLRMDGVGGRVIFDPFHSGVARSASDLRDLLKLVNGAGAALTPEHYRGVTDREILLRLQNNVKLRLLQMGDPAKAAAILENMLLFAPQQVGLWRELGLAHISAGAMKAAIAALERHHAIMPTQEIASLLQSLRVRLN